MSHKKANVSLITFDKHQLGHDLRLLAETATVEDVLAALAEFALEYLSDCRGCDGCCHERVPLTAPDIAALAQLLPPTPYAAVETCRAFAEISVDKAGIADITLKRDEEGTCIFLNKQGQYCQNWQARPFVCCSHFCLPKSERLIALRSVIVNSGENELIRQLLAEEDAGAQGLLPPEIKAEDFPPDPLFATNSWQDIRIKDIVPQELWQMLRHE